MRVVRVPVLLSLFLLMAVTAGHLVTLNLRAPTLTEPLVRDQTTIARGMYLAAAAGCAACHTDQANNATPFSGGRAIATPYGSAISPNITADADTGIGGWTETDFLDAVTRGISPDGSHYYPAFPYTSYARMTDQDVLAIFAWLRTLEAVENDVDENRIGFPWSWRYLQRYWKWLYFDPSPLEIRPAKGEAWNRGAYLVEAAGHCAECHTERTWISGLDQSARLRGGLLGTTRVPDLTSMDEGDPGTWTASNWRLFLDTGLRPDFDDVQGDMAIVIRESTSRLTTEDREAMITYLMDLPDRP